MNVLHADQAYFSDAFAGRFKDQVPNKFDCADWVAMPTGAPGFIDPLVGFDCTIVSSNLAEGDQRRVLESLQAGEIDLARLYDLDLPNTLEYTALTQLNAYSQRALDPREAPPYGVPGDN